MFETRLVHVCVVCLDTYSNWDYEKALDEAGDARQSCDICGLYARGIDINGNVCPECGRVIGQCPHIAGVQDLHINLPDTLKES